jgi:hypothetical protein
MTELLTHLCLLGSHYLRFLIVLLVGKQNTPPIAPGDV